MGKDRPDVVAWKAAYRELDSSSLLALVPVLDSVIAGARREFQMFEDNRVQLEKSVDTTTEHLQLAMTLREQGTDVTEYVAVMEAQSDRDTACAAHATKCNFAMFAYVSDLMCRRHWIMQFGCQRRGLLPDPRACRTPEHQGT